MGIAARAEAPQYVLSQSRSHDETAIFSVLRGSHASYKQDDKDDMDDAVSPMKH